MFIEFPFKQHIKSFESDYFKNCIVSIGSNFIEVRWEGYREVWECCKRILDKENKK